MRLVTEGRGVIGELHCNRTVIDKLSIKPYGRRSSGLFEASLTGKVAKEQRKEGGAGLRNSFALFAASVQPYDGGATLRHTSFGLRG